ncbi:MAG: Tol biopolymer transport system component/imidazolonepropionase-like amidohydrolase [Chlamydiales bacterium]|jgi:Tol biopolymer transport system component/imidazolonepropionase-like amidohydrolase
MLCLPPSLLLVPIVSPLMVSCLQHGENGHAEELAAPAQEGVDDADAKEEDAWDVQTFTGPSQEARIDTREGTWMSVDVHPDGDRLVFDLLGDIYVLPIEGGEAQAVATGVAWQYQPRFSPDGQRIAYTSDESGGDNVWVMEVDGSEAQAVTNETFRLLNSPTWSPDGRFIAARKHFTQRRSAGAGEIWMYHVGAGLAETAQAGLQLTKRPNDQKDLGEPAFSPDGRYVYFSYDATGGSTFQYSKDATAGIYSIDRLEPETGRRVNVVSGPGGACRPTPSPDGKSLAFVRRVNFKSTLFVMDLSSGESRAVYGDLERDMQETWALHGVYPGIAWTPDSKDIVFWAGGELRRVEMASGEVVQIPFHVNDTRTVQEALRFPVEVAPATFDVKALRSVRVSPAGDRVVYQALGHLWVRDLPDGTPKRLTAQTEHFEFEPSFSRDGSKIVYTTFDDEDLGAIRVVSVSGGEGTRLSAEAGHFGQPVFTPDGQQIVYAKRGGGYITSPLWSFEPGIYRMPATGGESTLVTRKGRSPQFAGSSERVFLMDVKSEKDSDERSLFSIDLDGSDERTHLMSSNATEYALSPDGNWVAFAEGFKAFVAPFVLTGRTVDIGPKTKSLPVTQVARDAGENLQWSGDSTQLHWSLGAELYTRPLTDAFSFIDGAPEELPEPPTEGHNVSFQAPYAAPTGMRALVGARVVTMRGDEVIENATLLIDGNRIRAIGVAADVDIPAGTPVVDVSGATIIPGLVDVHYHGATAIGGITPESNWVHQANLAFGVTTVHDPSHDTNDFFAVSEMAKAGRIVAPRLFSTGTILYGAMGSFKAEIDSLDDALSHLRRLQAVGAISVKSYNQPRRDQRQQVLAAARELGMMVVPEGGSDHNHNLTMVVDGHTGLEHSLPLENIYADITQLWGATDVGYTPTLVVGYGGIWGENYWYDHTDVWRNERLRAFVPGFVVEPRARRRTKAPIEDYNTLRSAGITKALVDAGSRVQLGAHGQLAGLAAHWELWMFEQGGMTPMEALRSATLSGAYYLGLDGDIGSLEVGKLADLVVIDGNPLEDLRSSERVRYTMLNGVLFDAATMAVAGDPDSAPSFFWQGMEGALPQQTTNAGCAGCAH